MIFAFAIICHLLAKALNQISFGFFLEVEISLCPCKFILSLLQPFITDFFLWREIAKANALSESHVHALIENARKALYGDTVSFIDILDLFIGKATELLLTILWVRIRHVNELNLAALMRLGINRLLTLMECSLSCRAEDGWRSCNRENVILMEWDRSSWTRCCLIKVLNDGLFQLSYSCVAGCHAQIIRITSLFILSWAIPILKRFHKN